MQKLDVFMNFDGNAEEVISFYEKAFSKKAEGTMKFKDMPPSEDFKVAEGDMEKIMYSKFSFGNNSVMISDLPEQYAGVRIGNNLSICITFDNEEELERVFSTLSDEGNVTMPLEATFFSPKYGELDDKFGIHWALLIEGEDTKTAAPGSDSGCIKPEEPRH